MASFSTANGPPPGLSAPPGLSSSNGTSGSSVSGMGSPTHLGMVHSPFGGPMSPMPAMKSPPLMGGAAMGSPWNGQVGQFPDYMLGR